jgi:transcription-repair coupling factor (superfamily II helicase)
VPEVVTINLDVPGEAHLPKNYVEADDARLEAYRRLAGVTTMEELAGPSRRVARSLRRPAGAAIGLLELAQLRLTCLELKVSSLVVMPAKVGVRSKPVVKLGPLELSLSQQMRLRRLHGSRAYVEATKELRIEVTSDRSLTRTSGRDRVGLVAATERRKSSIGRPR